MRRPRGSKKSKAQSRGKGKATGPTSEGKKTRSLDDVLDAKMLEIRTSYSDGEEGEILSLKSSLNAL